MRWRWRLETRTPRQPSTPALPQILDFTRSVLGFSRGCQAKEVEERGGRGEGGREVMEEMGRSGGEARSHTIVGGGININYVPKGCLRLRTLILRPRIYSYAPVFLLACAKSPRISLTCLRGLLIDRHPSHTYPPSPLPPGPLTTSRDFVHQPLYVLT